MRNYKTIIAMSVVGFACADVANASMLTGTMAVADYPLAAGGSFTSSSLTLNALNLITGSPTLPGVPALSDLTAYSTAITGLSSTATTLNISDFFVFSTPDGTFGGSGTTPNGRYDFNLSTLAETAFLSSPNIATFYGTGTLVDTTGAFADTAADFTLSFSGQGSYSFTLAAEASPVPEPTTVLAGALLLLPLGIGAVRSMRKVRAV
jgi:hypothetical protein